MSTNIARSLNYDGDTIAQLFFDCLTDANFHTETKILHSVWEAMSWTCPVDGQVNQSKMIDAAIIALQGLKKSV